MLRWVLAVVAALTSSTGIAGAEPAVAHACSADLAGAMTWPRGASAPLVCTDGHWSVVTDPYPFDDRWVSTGVTMTLRGGARPNPSLAPGDWVATPLSPDTRCRAEQVSVTYGRVDGPPRIDEGSAGRPLPFEVIPRLLTIDLSGECLWQHTEHG